MILCISQDSLAILVSRSISELLLLLRGEFTVGYIEQLELGLSSEDFLHDVNRLLFPDKPVSKSSSATMDTQVQLLESLEVAVSELLKEGLSLRCSRASFRDSEL